MINIQITPMLYKHIILNMQFTDIDDCAGVTCSGHGQCVDGVASYTCECDVGYTGNDCQTGKPKRN